MPDDQQMHLSAKELWPRFRGWFGALSLWVKIVIFLAVVAGIGLIFAQVSPNPAQIVDAELMLEPATGAVRPNSTLEVLVEIVNPSRQSIYAVENYIMYDPHFLDISAMTCVSGEDRCIGQGGSLFSQVVTQEAVPGNASPGTPTSCPAAILGCNVIHIVRGAPYPGVVGEPPDYSVHFITLKFRAMTLGTTAVEFNLNDSHLVMVASNGGVADILNRGVVHSGAYTIRDTLACTDPPPVGYGGYLFAPPGGGGGGGGAGPGTCDDVTPDGIRDGLPCATNYDCPRPMYGTCSGSGGTCVYNNVPCPTGETCVGDRCSITTTQLCRPPCTSGEYCQASVGCKMSTGYCLSARINDRACVGHEDCFEHASCGGGANVNPDELCLGAELPDSDTATVCCDQPCTPVRAGQLYITNVAAITLDSSSESITWSTYPVKSTPSTCDLTYNAIGGTPIPVPPTSTGNPDGHEKTITGLTAGTYEFHITCNLTGFAAAGHNGTFTIVPSTAELLRIEDLAAGNVTCNSAIVTYGTTKEALGTVGYAVRPITTPATACTGLSYTLMPRDTVATLAHRTIITSSTGLAANTEYCVRASAVTQTTPPETSGYAYASFRTPECAAIGPDANVIMKVTRDRVCKNWLYCQSAVKLKSENDPMCFDLGVCDTLNAEGACANPVALEGATGRNNATFNTPSQVHLIQNISGFAKVGLAWNRGHCSITANTVCNATTPCPSGETCIPDLVEGLYPYVRMSEKGTVMKVPNGNFESGQRAPWRPAQNGTQLFVLQGKDPADLSYVMKAVPGVPLWSGAQVPLGAFHSATGTDPMVLTFGAMTEMKNGYCSNDPATRCRIGLGGCGAGTCTGKIIRAQLVVNTATATSIAPQFFDFVTTRGDRQLILSDGWATYQMRLGIKRRDGALPATISGEAYLQFVQQDGGALSPDAFYLDDVIIQPVLETAAATAVSRSCRLYPTQDAPGCDFLDEATAKEYKGWKGYCVERQDPDPSRYLDPTNACLIWWPVDVLLGSSDLFSS